MPEIMRPKSPADLWVDRLESLLDGAEVALEQHLADPERSEGDEATLRGTIRLLRLDLAQAHERPETTRLAA
ncbi:hypothetical protein [Salinarimonas soli]|uniref:Uncharacterized protein n=1 Tax=Salinarimonas soli TaxID=1638099 RepID=A0A5B2VTI4_9HYPH|nr:hypothetical protein [Salinarimonas soli]KAA2242345.1 hypothetical protein F0L46_03420 [Salinarimonas soli]